MTIRYLFDDDGGFIAGDHEIAVYSYPSSPNAELAKRKPAVAARRSMGDGLTRSIVLRTISRYTDSAEYNQKWLAMLDKNGTEIDN